MGKVISVNFDRKERNFEFDDLRSALRRLSTAVEEGNNQSKEALDNFIRLRSLIEKRLGLQQDMKLQNSNIGQGVRST